MIQIVTDSTASIPAWLRKELNIDVLSLYVHYNNVTYEETSMDIDAFYSDIYNMIDNPPKSSQPNVSAVEDYFMQATEAGNSVVGIFISSLMSGTFESAIRAAKMAETFYPDFQYALVDSLSNGSDEAFSVLSAVAARDAGASCYQCAQAAADSVETSRFLFAPESLNFLRAGGRIGGGAALLGNALKITPIFTVKDGAADVYAKVRTQKKALAAMINALTDDAKKYELNDVVVHYIGNKTPAEDWAKSAVEPLVGHAVPVFPVSPVIGTHVGPAIGIAYQCKHSLKGKLSKRKPELVCSAKMKRGVRLAKLPFVSRFAK